MPVSVVQSHPKLNAVQFSRLRWGCFFRVGDAGSGRHQVKFSRMQKALTTRAVIVHDFTREQPRYGLKTDVRMRSDVHRFAGSKTHRSEAIKEAPRTNHGRSRTGKILRTVRAPTSALRAGKDSSVRLAERSSPAVS